MVIKLYFSKQKLTKKFNTWEHLTKKALVTLGRCGINLRYFDPFNNKGFDFSVFVLVQVYDSVCFYILNRNGYLH